MDVGRVVVALVLACAGAVVTVLALGLTAGPLWVLVLAVAPWVLGAAFGLNAVEARAYRRWREREDARYDRAVEALGSGAP